MKSVPIYIRLNLKTHHSQSKNTYIIKRPNTLFYRMRLYYYNMLIDELPNLTDYDFLDNIDTYIEYSKKQKRLNVLPNRRI
jgi:hypothetical protein